MTHIKDVQMVLMYFIRGELKRRLSGDEVKIGGPNGEIPTSLEVEIVQSYLKEMKLTINMLVKYFCDWAYPEIVGQDYVTVDLKLVYKDAALELQVKDTGIIS